MHVFTEEAIAYICSVVEWEMNDPMQCDTPFRALDEMRRLMFRA